MTIFRQWQQVLDETKTETRRGNFIYKVGSIQPIIPRYLAPSVWWHPVTGERVENPRAHLLTSINHDAPIKCVNEMMLEMGYMQGKVLIVDKRTEPVQAITETGAMAEGILYNAKHDGYYCPILNPSELYATAVDCYHALWLSINPRGKWCWEANPTIVVVTFKLVKPSVE